MFLKEFRILWKAPIEAKNGSTCSLEDMLERSKAVLLNRPQSLEKMMPNIIESFKNKKNLHAILTKFCREISASNPVLGEQLKKFLEKILETHTDPLIAHMATDIHQALTHVSQAEANTKNQEALYPREQLTAIRRDFFQMFPPFSQATPELEELLKTHEVPGVIPFGILDAMFRFSFIRLGEEGKTVINEYQQGHNINAVRKVFQSFTTHVLPNLLRKEEHQTYKDIHAHSLILNQVKKSMQAEYGRNCTEREWAGFQKFLELLQKEAEAHKVQSENISMEEGVAKVASAKDSDAKRALMAEHIGYKSIMSNNRCITPGMDIYYFLKLYNQGIVTKKDICEVMCFKKFNYSRFAPVLYYMHPSFTVARQQYIEAFLSRDPNRFHLAKVKWETEVRKMRQEMESSQTPSLRDILDLMIRESTKLIHQKSQEGLERRLRK